MVDSTLIVSSSDSRETAKNVRFSKIYLLSWGAYFWMGTCHRRCFINLYIDEALSLAILF